MMKHIKTFISMLLLAMMVALGATRVAGADTLPPLWVRSVVVDPANGWDYEDEIIGALHTSCDAQQDACRNRPGVPCRSAHSRSDYPVNSWMIADQFDPIEDNASRRVQRVRIQPFGSLARGDISGTVRLRLRIPGRVDEERDLSFSGGCRWQQTWDVTDLLDDWTTQDVNTIRVWVLCPAHAPDVFISAIKILIDDECIPISVSQPPQSRTVCAGAAVTFCVGASGGAAIGYQWSHNGSSLPGQTDSCLRLNNVALTQAGNYCCTISNGCADPVTVCASLDVRTPPAPLTRIDATPNPSCGSRTVTLTAIEGSGDRICWYTAPCGTVERFDAGRQINLNVTQTTTIWARSESDYCDPSSCVSVEVRVVPPPVSPTSAAASPADVCSNSTGQVELRAAGGSGTTVVWRSGSCTGPLVTTGNPAYIDPPRQTTSYYPSFETEYCPPSGCPTIPAVVTVHPAPTLPDRIIADPPSICYGRHPQLTLTLQGGTGERAAWYLDDCGRTFIDYGSTLRVDPPPRVTTTYFARWESDACAPSACVSITIQVTESRGDWNQDGVVDSRDLFAFLEDFFSDEGDFNADAVVNSQDLFDFLTAFFASC